MAYQNAEKSDTPLNDKSLLDINFQSRLTTMNAVIEVPDKGTTKGENSRRMQQEIQLVDVIYVLIMGKRNVLVIQLLSAT